MSVPGSGYEVGNPYTERSEGEASRCLASQTLRCAQGDNALTIPSLRGGVTRGRRLLLSPIDGTTRTIEVEDRVHQS